jgi:hypothetical protein
VIIKTEQIKKLLEQHKEKVTLNGFIDFQYMHKGLSGKSKDIADIHSSLRIRLFEYTYRIESDQIGSPLIEKKYDESLSDPEIDQIISQISKKSLENIKALI